MKQTIFFSLIFSLLALSGCRNSDKPVATNGEGVIKYKITYPANNPYKDIRILPRETVLFFKGTKASFITSGMSVIQIVNLLDFENKKYSSLLINSLGENFAFTETKEDIYEQEHELEYTFETTSETKLIAGLECNNAIVTDKTNKTTFDIYYYSKIKVYLGCSPFSNFNYLLMEYQHSKYGFPMFLQATKVDFNPIDTTLLEIKGDYNWVDKQTFFSMIKNLKVPL